MWELDYKESWALKNWCFWTVVLEKTLEIPVDCKEIQPVHPKGDQSWVFIGRTDVEAETPILWPHYAKSWLIWKDPDAGKDWRREEKGTTEDEMLGWHHRLDGHEFGWTLGIGDEQGGLACCGSLGHKELDMTEQLNWTELNGLVVFPTFFNLSLNLAIRSSCSEPQSAPGLVFAWLYRASPSLAARIQSIWFQCWPSGDVHVKSSLELLEEGVCHPQCCACKGLGSKYFRLCGSCGLCHAQVCCCRSKSVQDNMQMNVSCSNDILFMDTEIWSLCFLLS